MDYVNKVELEYVYSNDEITFYDERTKKEFINTGLRNYIRLFGLIPEGIKLVIKGEKTMAKTIKKAEKVTKSAKPTAKADAKKPSAKPATKAKSK
jgi:hypothetical protein